jgi:hypothetical protein
MTGPLVLVDEKNTMRRMERQFRSLIAIEQFNFENVTLLGKDLPANPCREIGVGGLCRNSQPAVVL